VAGETKVSREIGQRICVRYMDSKQLSVQPLRAFPQDLSLPWNDDFLHPCCGHGTAPDRNTIHRQAL